MFELSSKCSYKPRESLIYKNKLFQQVKSQIQLDAEGWKEEEETNLQVSKTINQ